MKAVLYLPEIWKKVPRYKPLHEADFRNALIAGIRRGLSIHATAFSEIPVHDTLTLEIQWVSEPHNCQPTLVVGIRGVMQDQIMLNLGLISRQLANALRPMRFHHFVPECEVQLEVTHFRRVAIED